MTDLTTIQELSVAGRHQECLQACQNALQTNPEETYAYKYAGKSLLILGQFEKAEKFLIKAHQLDRRDPEIANDIGNLFSTLGNQQDAAEWYEKALKIDNEYALAFSNIATMKKQSGNNKEAIILYKRAIQADPKLIQAYIGVSASFLALGDLEQSASFARKSLEINASSPAVNEILGIISQKQKNTDQAIDCYQKELIINPKARNSLLNLGRLLLQKGQIESALQLLIKASDLASSEQCSVLLAQAYQCLRQFKEAIIEYKKINITRSTNKLIPFNLGLCLLNTGNNVDAIEAFKVAVQIDDSFIAAWGNIGTALMNEGRYLEALSSTKKVIDLDPDNPGGYINLGTIYKNIGQLDQALVSTLKSLELQPDNPTVHMNLGSIYQDLGKNDRALISTLKALELQPDNAISYMNLGVIHKNLGQYDDALASTLKSLELNPDNPNAHMNLGIIYKNLGQLEEALTSTLKSLEIRPDNADSLTNLGGIYKYLGQIDNALASTLRSLEIDPSKASTHMNLGDIYKELNQLDQALSSTHKSIELDPDNADALMNLGSIYQDIGEIEISRNFYQKGCEIKPSLENKCQAYLKFDDISIDVNHINRQREEYLNAAKEIFKDSIEITKTTRFPELSLFMLTYQNGENDREFMEALGKLSRPSFDILGTENINIRNLEKPKIKKSKIRIGFYFDNPQTKHPVISHFFNILKAAAEEGFEILIIKGPTAASKHNKELNKIATRIIQLSPTIRSSVKEMKELKLDLLVYTEIHSSAAPYCLACNRIAPVQIVLPGNSITTGLSTVDYYLSSNLTETKHSENNYSETLIKLNGIPTGLNEPFFEKQISSRETLKLPLDKPLFGLLHNPIKYHPDMDSLLEELAQKNPKAIFITSKGANQHQTNRIIERWKKFAPITLSQTIFLDKMEKNDYLRTLKNLDLLLDPIYRGCGTTGFDAIAVGLPVVTLPGAHSRSRLMAGIYKGIGLKNAPIALDRSDYINWCNKIASSATLRDDLRASILDSYSRLTTMNKSTTQEMIKFFKAAVQASMTGQVLQQNWNPKE